jgi:hypothetical protein
MKQLYFTRAFIAFLCTLFVSFSLNAQVFISEIHYDNSGTDEGEGVEVTGPAGTDLSNYDIIHYNGSSGLTNGMISLSGTILNEGSNYGAVFFPMSPLQNGQEGLALVHNGVVVEFLSYEGSFLASNGPASGLTSTDIGVIEQSSTAIGESLQLTAGGWVGPISSTYSSLNLGLFSPVVGFDSAITTVSEVGAIISINLPVTLNNHDGNQVDLSISVDAGNSTAEASDYNLNTTALSFNADGTQQVSVDINDDTDLDDETLILELTETTSTGVVFVNSTITIKIFDDDIPTYDIVINEILADPGSSNDANKDLIYSTTEDEFIEFYNFGSNLIDISNWEIHDNIGLKFTFPPGTNIASGDYIVVFGGGSPNLSGVTTFTTTGGLQLNNGGDDIKLFDSTGNLVLQVVYGNIANYDQSIARSPDVTGVFMKHNDILSNPENFSAGLSNTTAVLPIDLLQFTAKIATQEVILNWSTASELNNDYMEIERAIDGVQFEVLGRVIGAGTSTLVNHYTMTDENPIEGVSYYRLKQVDFDGTVTYSNTLSVEFGDASNNYVVYPNPGKHGDQLTIVGDITPGTKIELIDQSGKVVLEQQFYRSDDRVLLNLSSVKAGLYAVRFIQGQHIQIERLILN